MGECFFRNKMLQFATVKMFKQAVLCFLIIIVQFVLGTLLINLRMDITDMNICYIDIF